MLCKKHNTGYIPYGKALYIGFMEGPKFMKWAAIPSIIIVNTIMLIFQFCSLCLYYEFVCVLILKLCYSAIDKNLVSLYVFPLFVFIYFINNHKIMAFLSILADILLIVVCCMILYNATSSGVSQKTHLAFRGARFIPGVMCTALYTLETTGVVRAMLLKILM